MKRFIVLTNIGITFLFPTFLCAQKFDNVWVMGYNWDTDPEAETYRLNFDTFPPRLEIFPGDLQIDNAYAGICDSLGNLQLYTNNCAISNGEGNTITNGDTMTDGWDLEWCITYGWHPFSMHNLFIPMPGESRKIYLLSKSTYVTQIPTLEAYQNKLVYSIVDMGQGSEAPKVAIKNQTVLQGRLGYGQITAVKHGNGLDWWIPIPEEKGNKIFMLLCKKDGIHIHDAQYMGPMWNDSGAFQASFSPDGSRYARYNRYYGLYLYDFDRCSGTLSNLRFFPFITTTQGLKGGVSFSPDSRLLYFADYDSLYQMNITVSDILSTKRLVAVYDGYISGILGSKFSQIAHGPDDRIYIVPPGSTRSMHVINRPNLAGEECDVQQHFIEFPNPYLNPPNHPNYRLGPLDGSSCDTLGIDNHPLADFRPDPTDTNALAVRFWDVSSYEPAEWLWDFGDGSAASLDTSPVHTFPSPGFYTVCLTVGNQYGVSSKCKIVEVKVSGVAEAAGGMQFAVYPNPTTGMLMISGLNASGCLADMFDISGRKVTSLRLTDNNIDLSGLSAGIYFVRLTQPTGVQIGISKVIISK